MATADRAPLDWNALLDAIPTAGVLVDVAARQIVQSNHRAQELLGAIKDGTDWNAWLTGLSPLPAAGAPMPSEQQPVGSTLLAGRPVPGLALSLQRPDGTPRVVRVSSALLRDGERTGMALVLFEEWTGPEAKAGQGTDNALAVEEDRRLNDFLAVLSHELRNPLGSIVNALFILDHAGTSEQQTPRAKQIIGRQVARLTNLVNDLLDVTRSLRDQEALRLERLDLNAAVHQAVEDNQMLFQQVEVNLSAALATRPLPVLADRNRILQALGILMQNAAKFTPKGGQAWVTVTAEGDEGLVRVADNGGGMDRETLGRLDRFLGQTDFSLESGQGGSGLGLVLAKRLTELHGGRLSAASEGLGRGSTFLLRLPLDAGAAMPNGSAARSGNVRRRILVIEDSADAADSLAGMLELAGHQVWVARDGEKGLAMARRHRPDVVLCDLGLPGMDGFAVAKALRADPDLGLACLVAVSGYARNEDRVRSRAAGFQHHLAKPFSPDSLERLLSGSVQKSAS
jgi:signal transduction histidine kinase/ActR/RegA family two-component response regulator